MDKYVATEVVKALLEDYERYRAEVSERIMGTASLAITMGKRIPEEAIRTYVERTTVAEGIVKVYV